MKQYASIFNDVLGPVMSGPSSSHTAASVRIANLMGQMLKGKLVKFTAEFDEKGALASCYHEQWVDMGLAAGLLGMLPDDDRLQNALDMAEEQGLEMNIVVCTFPNSHPNTYKLTLENEDGDIIFVKALSVGGGMVELVEIEEYEISISGGFYETIIFADNDKADAVKSSITSIIGQKSGLETKISKDGSEILCIFKTEKAVDSDTMAEIEALDGVKRAIALKPVLPVTSQLEPSVPFLMADELIKLSKEKNYEMWQMGQWFESVRGGITEEETFEKMMNLVKVMKAALAHGLAGTHYEKRILGWQSKFISDTVKKARLIPGEITNEIIKSVTALMEVKSSMGMFVAAPTAGSCGCVPGTILGIANYLNLPDEQIAKAMFAAGITGVFLAERATFAAEVAGCQAECGSGSGMAAAGLVQLMDGSPEECCAAASMALQNVFGMTCDPIAMAVEVPCLGKNVMGGMNAFSSANMTLAGFDHVIPLDQTIYAFNEVGRMIPPELRCTGMAGLTQTQASKDAEKMLS